ncbi:heme-binding domain-containing protein [Nitrosophilus kaiyonis]|uniref:heme-binding domain-containing protein n=1 Tax=Nitrosophilus kaiyonis TaxID=2930200 RepID=UPI002490542E|nr:heme-binding domain-containing protein [Nitrosophilus kaiyonis]
MKSFLYFIGVLIVIFVIFQFIPSYEKANPTFDKTKEIKISKDLKSIFKKSCYDCHSFETNWPWYADVAPMKWVVRRDVVEGRKALNFSIWDSYPNAKKEELKKKIFRSINLAMPLPQYLWLHPDAKLSSDDKKKVQNWASNGKGYIKMEVR